MALCEQTFIMEHYGWQSNCQTTCNESVSRFSPFLQATQALRVSRGIAVLFLGPSVLDGGEGVSLTPRPPQPLGQTPCPFYRRLGGP